ncbi:MAG TPA: HD domain-containing phosphohydrolase [Solirubrobacteraceae bacterium]|nr:HD domain-containing phosphohydrolase [Solirubrobacteraceae bacterium]
MPSSGHRLSAERPAEAGTPVRAAEVIGAMSIATDLGTGQPLEHALRTAILAVRLGELAGLSPGQLMDAYYISLLHSFGCTSDAPEQTELFGDDIEPRAKFALVDGGNPEEVAAFLTDVVGQGRPAEVREAMVAHALENAVEIARSTFALHCEVAQRFAGWLGFGPGVISNLAYVFERWDGNGFPGAAAGEGIALPARVLHVARDISVFLSAADPDRACQVIEQRSGGAYDPHLASLATDHFDQLLDGLDDSLIWGQAMAAEPPPQRRMSGEDIDAAFRVVGTFTDLKSYWLRGHADGTSELAEAAAWRLGLPEEEVKMVRRAALALDVGRVAVSNAIWEKPGPFGLTDWERVQLHPYFTERSFAHSSALAPIGELAGSHHERLNGTGYHRRTLAPGLGRAARILAAADSYQAMRERRPHRRALAANEAEAELLQDVDEGRLCPEAVDAVLAAAGHRVVKRPRQLPAGLTDRELEVLLALASGKTNKEIAEGLGISVKTAGHHVQHIFDKTGARTRSAATVWAFERHLVQAA